MSNEPNKPNNPHEKIEKNVGLLAVLIAVVVAMGGLVEIVPLMHQAEAIEPLPGVEPYPPLELAGRDVYVREGCFNCHSQMVRTLRFETERYGHYSLAGESVYDRPHQWGSKRTGPDLARVGGRYSDEWHVQHLKDPRSVVPESVMPAYAFLAEKELDTRDAAGHLKALRAVGVPYTDRDIDMAERDMRAQGTPDADAEDLADRYPKAQVRDFDGDPNRLTEMDALVAYLQVLGTMVDVNSAAAQQVLASEKGR